MKNIKLIILLFCLPLVGCVSRESANDYYARNPEMANIMLSRADPTVRRDPVADEVRAAADRKRLGLPPLPTGGYQQKSMPPYVPKPK